MKHIRIFLIGSFFLSGILHAQTDFRSGYVIDNVGDTLFGEINYQRESALALRCEFRQNETAEKQLYHPDDIQGLRFNDSKYFVSKEVDGKKVFLEFLINGEVNIYFYRSDSGEGSSEDRYFLEKDDTDLIEIPYSEKMIEKDGKSYEHKSTLHMGLLTYHLEDAPKLKSKITSITKPGHKNLIKLGKAYHEQVCEDGVECIVYEKRNPAFKLGLELVTSITQYNNDVVKPEIGVFLYFHPGRTEKIFVKTGLNAFSGITRYEQVKTFWVLPLQIGYIYPKGKIRPKISYGPNMWFRPQAFFVNEYLQFTYTWEGGCNIQLSEQLFLTVTGDIDQIGMIVPSKLLSYSGRVGLFVSL